MTIRELLKGITKQDLDKEIVFSCDEELNGICSKGEIAFLSDIGKFVVYPLSGTEI